MYTNVVPIEETQKYKFAVDTVWIDWFTKKNGEQVKKQMAVICLRDVEKNVDVVHPITDYILSQYKSKSYNTQRKHAKNVAMFLNYILTNKRSLHIKSIMELKLSHGTRFLNYLTEEGRQLGTVKDAERTLTNFYVWLAKNNITPHISLSNFPKKPTYHGTFYYESPFDAIYPSRTASKVEHVFPIAYIPLLFEIAICVTPRIVLGLYFQLFGGLRVGEVVNLKRASLQRKMATGDLMVRIETNSFRTDIRDSSGSNYVKKPRPQRIYQIKDWLDHLLQDHLEMFKPDDGSGALFVNRDGSAMTGRSYRQYFDKLKRTFIQYLRQYGGSEDKILANHLSTTSWSTHIGRGTFTNMLAEHAESPLDVAFPRGDKSLESLLTYMSKTERMRKKIEEKLAYMHEYYVPQLIERNKNNTNRS